MQGQVLRVEKTLRNLLEMHVKNRSENEINISSGTIIPEEMYFYAYIALDGLNIFAGCIVGEELNNPHGFLLIKLVPSTPMV